MDDVDGMNYYPLVEVKIGLKRFFVRYIRDDRSDIPWNCYAGFTPAEVFVLVMLGALVLAAALVALLHFLTKKQDEKAQAQLVENMVSSAPGFIRTANLKIGAIDAPQYVSASLFNWVYPKKHGIVDDGKGYTKTGAVQQELDNYVQDPFFLLALMCAVQDVGEDRQTRRQVAALSLALTYEKPEWCFELSVLAMQKVASNSGASKPILEMVEENESLLHFLAYFFIVDVYPDAAANTDSDLFKALAGLADVLAVPIQEEGHYLASIDEELLPSEISMWRRPVRYYVMQVTCTSAGKDPHILSCDTVPQAERKLIRVTKYYNMKFSDWPKKLQVFMHPSSPLMPEGDSPKKVPLRAVAKYFRETSGRTLHMGDLCTAGEQMTLSLEEEEEGDKRDYGYLIKWDEDPRNATDEFVPLKGDSVSGTQEHMAGNMIYLFKEILSASQTSSSVQNLLNAAADGLKNDGKADSALQVKLALSFPWCVFITNACHLLDMFCSGGVRTNLLFTGQIFAELTGGEAKDRALNQMPGMQKWFNWKDKGQNMMKHAEKCNGGGGAASKKQHVTFHRPTALDMVSAIVEQYKHDMPDHYPSENGSFGNKFPNLRADPSKATVKTSKKTAAAAASSRPNNTKRSSASLSAGKPPSKQAVSADGASLKNASRVEEQL